MFLYNSEKKNMAIVYNYLISIRENYRSQINVIEKDIDRNNKVIEDAKCNLQKIQSSFDTSYLVLSSSQVAMANEYAEIDSLQEIINNRDMEINDLNYKRDEIKEKLLEIEEVIVCANSVRDALDKSFTWNIHVELFMFHVKHIFDEINYGINISKVI